MYVSNEILERGSSVRLGRGVLLGILGGGVAPGSFNPDPISDQHMPFLIRLHALVFPLNIIPGEWPKSISVFPEQNGSKSIL